MPDPHIIFNRQRVKRHRDRASKKGESYDFLLQEMAARLSDRLSDVKKIFPRVLDLGAHAGQLADHIKNFGIETLIQTDLSHQMLCYVPSSIGGGLGRGQSCSKVVADEELLPFAHASFDLVISVGSLHWVNDVPGTLAQIERILKPGGLFLANIPGGETLKELRASLEQTEMALSGGISPRISPFIDVKDAGSLLQRAGFVEPVTDCEILTVSYAHPMKLLHDLRGMGESNALLTAQKHMSKRTLFSAAMSYYQQRFQDKNGRVPATFEIVTLTAWKKSG